MRNFINFMQSQSLTSLIQRLRFSPLSGQFSGCPEHALLPKQVMMMPSQVFFHSAPVGSWRTGKCNRSAFAERSCYQERIFIDCHNRFGIIFCNRSAVSHESRPLTVYPFKNRMVRVYYVHPYRLGTFDSIIHR